MAEEGAITMCDYKNNNNLTFSHIIEVKSVEGLINLDDKFKSEPDNKKSSLKIL